MNLLDYYDWLGVCLNDPTAKSLGLPDAKPGQETPLTRVSNYVKLWGIQNACKVINQQVGLAGTSTPRDLPIAPQSGNGPYIFDMGVMPGFSDRAIQGIRRAWWWDGTTTFPLDKVILSELDNKNDPYLNDAPGTPRRFATEGYSLYLDPGPASSGAFRFMATAGTVAPNGDNDSFHGIPDSYDPSVLFIAADLICKSMPADAEMSQRASGFASDAAAGLERLKSWFNGGSNEEAQPSLIFDARFMRRGRCYVRR